MADILEKFDFDDSEGLKKVRAFGEELSNVSAKAKEMGSEVQKAVDESVSKSKDLDSSFDKIGKKIGAVGTIAKGVAGAAVVAFGAATAAAVKLASQNERINQQQEQMASKFQKVQEVIGEKIAPILYTVQQVVIDLLNKAIAGGNNLNSNVVVKLAAGIKGIQAAIGQAFTNLKGSIKLTKLDFQQLGKQIQLAFTFDSSKRAKLKAEIADIKREFAEIQKGGRSIGEAYTEAFQKAEKEIGDLVKSGFFKLKKANKEQLDQIMRLREEYAKLAKDIQDRVTKAEIANAEGIRKLVLENEFAKEQIDLLEQRARATAKAAGLEFDLEEEFRDLREQAEIAFQKKVTDFQRKEAEERLKQLKQDFKDRFGVEFDSLDEFEKKVTDARLKRDIDDVASTVATVTARAEQIAAKQDLGVFDKIKQRILSSLGISEEDARTVLGSIGNALSSLQDAFTSNIDSQLEANAQLIEGIRERANVVQQELQRELDLQSQGRENNVASKRRELAELQKQEEEAQKERDKLNKKRLQAQFAADAAQQASSLATAAANLFDKSTKIAGPLGIGLAVAAIVSMFALISKYKAQAKAVSKPEALYKGGSLKKTSGFVNRLSGRSDVPGRGRGHRIEDSNVVVGGKEMIVAEGPANRQTDRFWDNMNAGKYDHLNLVEVLDKRPSAKEITNQFRERETKIVALRAQNRENLTRDDVKEIMEKNFSTLINYFKKEFPHYIAINEDTQQVRKMQGKSKDMIKFSPTSSKTGS